MKAGIRITPRGTGRKLQLAYAERQQRADCRPGHEPVLQTHCHGGTPGPRGFPARSGSLSEHAISSRAYRCSLVLTAQETARNTWLLLYPLYQISQISVTDAG